MKWGIEHMLHKWDHEGYEALLGYHKAANGIIGRVHLVDTRKITEDEDVTDLGGKVRGNEKNVTEGTRCSCMRVSKYCVLQSQEDTKKMN